MKTESQEKGFGFASILHWLATIFIAMPTPKLYEGEPIGLLGDSEPTPFLFTKTIVEQFATLPVSLIEIEKDPFLLSRYHAALFAEQKRQLQSKKTLGFLEDTENTHPSPCA